MDIFVGKYSFRSCELLPTSSIADGAWDRSNDACNSMIFLDESIIYYFLHQKSIFGYFFSRLDPVSMYVFILHKNNYVLILLIKNVCTHTIITRVRSYSFGRYTYILPPSRKNAILAQYHVLVSRVWPIIDKEILMFTVSNKYH